MLTSFNINQKSTNDKMRVHLKRIVVPYLRDNGFKGSFPCFRKVEENKYQIIQFQFNKYPGSFTINLSITEPIEGFLKIPLKDIVITRTQRLGTRQKRINRKMDQDHWFKFLTGFVFYKEAYIDTANLVVGIFELEAEAIYKDLYEALEKGVNCIHWE